MGFPLLTGRRSAGRMLYFLLLTAAAMLPACRDAPEVRRPQAQAAPTPQKAARPAPQSPPRNDDASFLTYIADPKQDDIACYWKDGEGAVIGSLRRMKEYAESKGRRLVFAMNGGMYMEDQAPLGLYIENFKQHRRVNKATGYGNFYMKPNGIFYLTADRKRWSAVRRISGRRRRLSMRPSRDPCC
jgi:uncharacterized protein YigE (DUF2233 family)